MTLADDIFDYKQGIKNDIKCRYPDGIKTDTIEGVAANVILIELFSKMDEVIEYLTMEGY